MSVTDGTGEWTGLGDTNMTTTTTTSGRTRGSPGGRHSTVWNQEPIADYLQHLGFESAATNTAMTSTATTSTPTAPFSEMSRGSLRRSARIETESDASATDTDDGTEGARSVVIEHDMDGEEAEVEDEDEDEDAGSSALSNPIGGRVSIHDADVLSPFKTQAPLLDDDDLAQGAYVDLDVEVEMEDLVVQGEGEGEGGEQPSLGYLDQALSFIAAERVRLDAQRAAGVGTSVKGGWRHVIGMYSRSPPFFVQTNLIYDEWNRTPAEEATKEGEGAVLCCNY